MQILTHVFGAKHIEIFKNTMLRSLSWPSNSEVLAGVGSTWNIFTDDPLKMNDICEASGLDIKFTIQGTDRLMEFIDPAQSAFLWQLRKCLSLNEKLLIAPGDLMFGDGSIGNLIQIGADDASVVVVPHMRVLPAAMDEITGTMTNAELVSLAFKHIHRSWIDAEKGCIDQTSFHGGVEWEYLGDKLYSVNHRLPAPYLVHFTQEDLEYFESASSFNSLDHSWPGHVLVPRGRQRYVGSSDACFLIEPTEENNNIPNLIPGQYPGGFWRNLPHNQHNAMVRAIFRGI